MKYKFKSEFLKEQIEKGYIELPKLNIHIEKCYKNIIDITGECVLVSLFPNNRNVETYFYDKKIKSKMIYHLKKEGFRFSSYTGQCGYYIKEL
jgi:hypothetical protein